MNFSIDNIPATLLDSTEYIIQHSHPEKRKIIAAMCTQSVFGFIYEQLQNCVDKNRENIAQQRIICEIGNKNKKSKMHAKLHITNSLIAISIHKRLQILEILPRGFNQTLDILDITIDIQMENYESPASPPVPLEICVKIEYE